MTDQATAVLKKGVPWRRGMAWWIVGLEGAILLAIGIYIVAAPDNARDNVRMLIGAFLLINSLLTIWAVLRASETSPAVPYRMLSAGVGLTVGLLVVFERTSDYIDADAAKVILALGLLGHGLIGLVGAFATRAAGGLKRGALIGGVLNVALAALLFYNVRKDTLDPRWFGYVAIAGGLVALGFAFMLYQQASQKKAKADEPPIAESPSPGTAVHSTGNAVDPALTMPPTANADVAAAPLPPKGGTVSSMSATSANDGVVPDETSLTTDGPLPGS